MASGFVSRGQLEKYIEFFRVRPAGTEMSIAQTIEKIENKIMITERILKDPAFG
ncbi:MAG: hypothetical protein Harvfovirus4_33 [Harvfovirus sp.]|uniref:Uncharacterized protein n=1 Tax=Harvfovirus sp. TaxID=2487768 RepID=A0A3G5A596_9VIRU|nr:MAG: hypothetical protein Harvfovirus4_33 [Harvfovirus sp.]